MNNLSIENAHIFGLNFSGVESKNNPAGKRSFCVAIDDPEQAQAMLEDGWNVRISAPRDEDESPRYYVPVAVNFEGPYPTKVVTISGGVKTQRTEDTIRELDHADIAKVDLTIRPYYWEVNGKQGIKAYLKTMYVTLEQDEFAAKYTDVDEEAPF